MKKIIRLTESDLVKLVKRIISEQPEVTPYHDTKSGRHLDRRIFDDAAAIPIDKEWEKILTSGNHAKYGTGQSLFSNNQFNSNTNLAIGNTLSGFIGARRINDDVTKFCRKYNDIFEYTSIPKSKIENIVRDISNTLERGRYPSWGQLSDRPASITGRGVSNETADDFHKKIGELQTINNFCYALKYSEQNKFGGEGSIMDMFDEISSNEVYYNKVILPMRFLNPIVLIQKISASK